MFRKIIIGGGVIGTACASYAGLAYNDKTISIKGKTYNFPYPVLAKNDTIKKQYPASLVKSDPSMKCFPESSEFKTMFFAELRDNMTPHEIEKMWPTMDKLVSNKCFDSYELIPHHVNDDYIKYLGRNGNEVLVIIATLGAEKRVEHIKNAMDNIAEC